MSLRYYPSSKIKPNKKTKGNEFTLNGKPYVGIYYSTFDGKFFTGANPVIGKNQELKKIQFYSGAEYLNNNSLTPQMRNQFSYQTNLKPLPGSGTDDIGPIQQMSTRRVPTAQFKGEPTSYFPIVLDTDYTKGYIMRFFVKRINSSGFVTEISDQEYNAIQAGTTPYDISFYLTTKIMWKLTGPLHTKRISQYDIRAGIVETNQRLVETAEKTFLGIKDFIGGKYDKYAKPTE
jgi:hypothetical protein